MFHVLLCQRQSRAPNKHFFRSRLVSCLEYPVSHKSHRRSSPSLLASISSLSFSPPPSIYASIDNHALYRPGPRRAFFPFLYFPFLSFPSSFSFTRTSHKQSSAAPLNQRFALRARLVRLANDFLSALETTRSSSRFFRGTTFQPASARSISSSSACRLAACALVA